MKIIPKLSPKSVKIGLVIALLGVVSLWAFFTPHGVDGKLGAVGYAVCHQIDSHTLSVGGRLLPLCARCTGMYLGALAALMVLAPHDKRGGSPSKAKLVVLAVLFLVFVVDGVNSSLALISVEAPLYPPSNLLRLVTGLMMGIILANLLIPLWNQSLWIEKDVRPVLGTWKRFLLLIVCEVAVGILVWFDIPWLYYPIGVLSTGTIFLILGMVYSLLWSIILNKENTLKKFNDGLLFFLLGLICAWLQIGLMDLVRFSLTGTWLGFQL
jgi:uncharacterized membrane protein